VKIAMLCVVILLGAILHELHVIRHELTLANCIKEAEHNITCDAAK
jgi:hypothetical protein